MMYDVGNPGPGLAVTHCGGDPGPGLAVAHGDGVKPSPLDN